MSYPLRGTGAGHIEAASDQPTPDATNDPIVFVGGVHGVGKTSVSKALARLLPASHVTAGTLIRETASAADKVAAGVGNKAVPNVDANQALLLHGLDLYRLRVGAQSRPLLLDGHFSLLDGAGQIVAIPLTVLVAIGPIAIVLVEASAHTVRERLLHRDKEAPPLETLSALADCERERAAEVSAALGIPLWTVSGDTTTEQAAAAAAPLLRSLFDGEA